MISDNKLNINQQKAASLFCGPIMVFAGAGSGKTRTLTYRVAKTGEENTVTEITTIVNDTLQV